MKRKGEKISNEWGQGKELRKTEIRKKEGAQSGRDKWKCRQRNNTSKKWNFLEISLKSLFFIHILCLGVFIIYFNFTFESELVTDSVIVNLKSRLTTGRDDGVGGKVYLSPTYSIFKLVSWSTLLSFSCS